MSDKRNSGKIGLIGLGVPIGLWLLLSLAFSLAYTQSHLYNDNQNTKFLHGLAMGGMGLLKEDWLANTADPLPAFSWLVSFTYAFLAERLFYVYFALLMGVYAYSIMGIVSTLYGVGRSPASYLAYLALVIAVHSIWGQIFIRKTVGYDPVILNFGLAGQYLLGLDFQNSSFGVFLLLSIHAFLQRHYGRAGVWLAVACIFHSAYLFSAGLLTVAYLGSLFFERLFSGKPLTATSAGGSDLQEPGYHRRIANPPYSPSLGRIVKAAREPFLLGLLTLALVAPVVVYNQAVMTSTSPQLSEQALSILVNQRIPHHAVVSVWWDNHAALQVALMIAAMFLVRRTRLFPVMLVAFLGGAVGTLVQILTGSNSLALLAPWRVSVFLVPLSTCLLIAWPVAKFFGLLQRPLQAGWPLIAVLSLAAIVALDREGLTVQRGRFTRYEKQDVHPMMSYVKQNKASGQIYLIPPRDNRFDEFRTYTGAPAFINWKSHPYRDFEVMEWYRRNQLAQDFYSQDPLAACATLESIERDYPVTHVVVDLEETKTVCAGMREVYRDQQYAVYSLAGH